MITDKKFNFVYITTNVLNGKQYVGDHSCDILEKDSYLGSGNLNNAINKYGKSNFKREILEFFQTKQEAFNAQEKYIKKYNTLSPNGYNISPTGGLCVKGCLSEESKHKISKANKGKQPWLGKHHTNETKKKISQNTHVTGEQNPFYNKHHTDETKKKISGKLIGKSNPHSKEQNIKIGLSNKGKKHSEETKKRIGLASKNRIPWNKGLKIKSRSLHL